MRPPLHESWISAETAVEPESRALTLSPWLRRIVWLYFWLLIFEGAARKWFLPQLAGPLLLMRDPVVLLLYGIALREGLRPEGKFARVFGLMFVAALFLLMVQWLMLEIPLTVLVYGLRTFFLHLPLIFLLPAIMDRDSIRTLGKVVLLLAGPMALLMIAQFYAPPDSWINRAPGTGDAKQLLAALGKVRPPGTFSFSTGPVSFFALCAAFMLHGLSRQGRYPAWLLVGSGFALAAAMAVCGSRSLVMAVGLVMAGWLVGTIAARRGETGVPRLVLLTAVVVAVLGQAEFFREGTEVLTTRWEMAAASERAEGGMIGRLWRSVIAPMGVITQVPWFGAGLGVGTNVGATLLTGRAQFLLSEEEWGRVVLELGPLLGAGFILWRLGLAMHLARACVRRAAAGDLLPLLLFGACVSHLLTGQIAQPTALGFTVLGVGLTCAALQSSPGEKVVTSAHASVTPSPRLKVGGINFGAPSFRRVRRAKT